MKLATALTLDETSASFEALERLREIGFDIVKVGTIGETESHKSSIICRMVRDAGLQSVLLLRQGAEDSWDAARVWNLYTDAGYTPDDIAGVGFADEPSSIVTGDDYLRDLWDKQRHADALADTLAEQAEDWANILRPDTPIWFNANTPSGRLYAPKDLLGPRIAPSFDQYSTYTNHPYETWSMEGWAGDIGGELQLLAWTSNWRTHNKSRIFYPIGQKAGPGFSALLRRAETQGVRLAMIWHLGPTIIQGGTTQNGDAYAPANVGAVHGGIRRWKAGPHGYTVPRMIKLLSPFNEDNEPITDEIRTIKNHPFEADWDYVIDAFATAAVLELNGYGVQWVDTLADADLKRDWPRLRPTPYPISQMANGAGVPWPLDHAPFHEMYTVHPGVKWAAALNLAPGADLDYLREDDVVREIEARILSMVPNEPVPPPPPPPPDELTRLRGFAADVRTAQERWRV